MSFSLIITIVWNYFRVSGINIANEGLDCRSDLPTLNRLGRAQSKQQNIFDGSLLKSFTGFLLVRPKGHQLRISNYRVAA